MSLYVTNPPAGIGSIIIGGTDKSVLFIHPNNTLAQDNTNFNFDDTNITLRIGDAGNADTYTSTTRLQLTGDLRFTHPSVTPVSRLISPRTDAHGIGADNLIVSSGDGDGQSTAGGYLVLRGGSSSVIGGGDVYIYGGNTAPVGNVHLATTETGVICGKVTNAGTTALGQETIYCPTNSTIGLVVRAATGQLVGLASFQSSTGSSASVIDGNLNFIGAGEVVCFSTSVGAAGSASAPAFQLGASNNGMYLSAANTLGIGTNGTEAISISSSQVVTFLAGSVSAPSVVFTGALTTGLYSSGANQLAIAVNGVQALQVNPQSSSNGPFIGLFGTAPSTSVYISSSVTSTGGALATFFSASLTYNPPIPTAASVTVLSFTAQSNKATAVLTAGFTAIANSNGATNDVCGIASTAKVSSSYTLSTGTVNIMSFQPRFQGGNTANLTGGTINHVAYDCSQTFPTETGSGVTQNNYALRSSAASSYLKHVGGQIYGRTAVNDANYTVLQYDYLIAYTSLTAGRTVTLPAPSATNSGQIFVIKDEAGGAATNNITVQGASGNIDGVSSLTITANYGSLRCYNNGTNYFTF